MAKHKRTKEERAQDRARVMELKLQKYSDAEITRILNAETGLELSRRQISYDVQKVRNSWLRKAQDDYEMHVNMELARIDALEKEIWRALRDSSVGKEKRVIEKILADGGYTDEMVVNRILETYEQTHVNPAYFTQIIQCQQERRKLLGLYAPQESIIRKIDVKGYVKISPGDWPSAKSSERQIADVIEGEIIGD